MQTLGKILSTTRESKGLTRPQLARLCGYSNQGKWAYRIWKIECGNVPFPGLDLLRRMTKALELEHSVIARAIFKNFLFLNQPIKPYLGEN
jgi:transcriptional regulator with XRE-family HTH domain